MSDALVSTLGIWAAKRLSLFCDRVLGLWELRAPETLDKSQPRSLMTRAAYVDSTGSSAALGGASLSRLALVFAPSRASGGKRLDISMRGYMSGDVRETRYAYIQEWHV